MTIIDYRPEIKLENFPYRSKTEGIIIHHTGGGAGGLISTIKNTKNTYHYAINSNGDIWYLLSDNKRGTHAGRTSINKWQNTQVYPNNPNTVTIGISFIGNFITTQPTSLAYNACEELILDLIKKFPNIKYLYGHLCVANTSCPGSVDFKQFRNLL